jgi:cytochrome oxidase assembly protein ShyY1
MGDLQIKFLILIVLVFLITAGFCILIWQQTKKFEKKALLAKQRQKEYEKELRLKIQEEKERKRKKQR